LQDTDSAKPNEATTNRINFLDFIVLFKI
jgi:hypothetical protein